MTHLQPTGSNIFLSIDSPVQEKITFKSGHSIYLPSNLETEKWATCKGIVSAIGSRCSLRVQVGETVAIDYRMVSDYTRKGDTICYNRALVYENQVVWRADDFMVMAVLRNGSWVALGDWVVLEEINSVEWKSSTIVSTELSEKKLSGCGRLISGSDAPVGSKVFFPEKFRSLYTFPDGKTYIIIKSDYVLAYTAPSNATSEALENTI